MRSLAWTAVRHSQEPDQSRTASDEDMALGSSNRKRGFILPLRDLPGTPGHAAKRPFNAPRRYLLGRLAFNEAALRHHTLFPSTGLKSWWTAPSSVPPGPRISRRLKPLKSFPPPHAACNHLLPQLSKAARTSLGYEHESCSGGLSFSPLLCQVQHVGGQGVRPISKHKPLYSSTGVLSYASVYCMCSPAGKLV